MIHTLQNHLLTVAVSDRGAELQSIRHADGTEFLWQGDPAYWPDRALVLFPYIARMTNGMYTYQGKTYRMPIHGFAPKAVFTAEQTNEHEVVFRLESSEETLAMYPFHFCFTMCYRLSGDTLTAEYRVENRSDETMYFAVGGHPGINVPMEPGRRFEEYSIRFAAPCHPTRIGFTPACFLSGKDTAFALDGDCELPLRHTLFDDDAIVLRDMTPDITLSAPDAKHAVRMRFSDFSYFGLWHWPKTDAPYVCLEPWSSLPSRQDVVEDLTQQKNLLQLQPHAHCVKAFTLQFA